MKIKYLKKLILFLFIINTTLYSQKPCDVPSSFYTYPFGFPHVSNVIGDSGFALNYSYPGVWSYVGQMNIYYTNSNGDVFLFGIGLPYLFTGMNKKIGKIINDSFLYLNFNFIFSENLSGSIGASNIFFLKRNNYFEVDLDLFYFGGINGDMIIPDVPQSYGALFNANYIYSTRYFNFTLFAGISFTRFYSSEVKKYFYGWMPGYACTSRDKPIWTDFYTNFPIGASVTIKF